MNFHPPIYHDSLANQLEYGANGSMFLPRLDVQALANPRVSGSEQLATLGEWGPSSSSLLPTQYQMKEPTNAAQPFATFRLALFMASNNMLSTQHAVTKELFGWLQTQKTTGITKHITSTKGWTSQALSELLFRCAVEAGDARIAESMLSAGFDPNYIFDNGSLWGTAMQHACQSRHTELVRVLIQHKASLSSPSGAGPNILILAIGEYTFSPSDRVPLELVHMLLEAGAKINTIDDRDRSALSHAAEWGLAEAVIALVSKGADVNFSNREGTTPLHFALKSFASVDDIRRMVESLVYAGADVNAFCRVYSTGAKVSVLSLAAAKGAEMVDFVLSHGASTADLSFNIAAETGSMRFVQLALENGSEPNCDSLGATIRGGNIDAVKLVLDAGMAIINDDVDSASAAESSLGRTDLMPLLFTTCLSGDREICANLLAAAILRGRLDYAHTFLEHGADVHSHEEPLRAAITVRNEVMVRELLVIGAESIPSDILAAAIEWGNYQVVKELVEAGADICRRSLVEAIGKKDRSIFQSLVDWGGDVNDVSACTCSVPRSPLQATVATGDIDMVRYILDMGANPVDENALIKAVPFSNILALIVNAITAKRPGRNIKRKCCGALTRAMLDGNYCAIQFLLESGIVDLDSRVDMSTEQSQFGEWKPFHHDDKRSILGTALRQKGSNGLRLTQLLLDAGADPNGVVLNYPHRTALLLAVEMKNVAAAELLISSGADIHAPAIGHITRTPLQAAAETENVDMVQMLLDRGASVNEPPAYSGGATALQLAALGGFVATANILIDAGADVNAAPAKVRGRTALEASAEHGRIDMLQTLVNAGADISGTGNSQYGMALHFATMQGHSVARKLLEHNHRLKFPESQLNERSVLTRYLESLKPRFERRR